jgi:putative peptidoglycan lipid II flippase
MVVATLGARIAGLIRVMVLAQFGTTGEINAYYQAFVIPDLVYFLIAGGALRTGFVPVFTEYIAKGKTCQAWRTFSSLFWILLIFGGLIVSIGIVIAPQLAVWIAPGWVGTEPELLELCGHLMRIIFPAQLCFVVGGLFMGTLNAQKHFFWPAMGPIVYDLFIITGALLAVGIPGIFGLSTIAYAVVLGALCGNVLLQIRPLLIGGARLQPILDLSDEGFKRVVRLALPIIFGLAVAEINYIVIRTFSTIAAPEQGPAVMEIANRLWKLPAGVFGAAIAIALFPMLSEHYAKDDEDRYRRDFSFGVRNTMFLTVPAALVMGLMPAAIIRVLFEYGEFTSVSTAAVAQVMVWFAPGIVALSGLYIVARAFYARHDTRTPLLVGVMSVAICIAMSFLLMGPMNLVGLALAMTVSNFVNVGALLVILKRRVGRLDGAGMVGSQLRCLPANVLLAAACIWGPACVTTFLGEDAFLSRLLAVFAPLLVGSAGFFALSAVLKVPELSSAWRMVGRRLRARKPSPGSANVV